MKIVTKLDDFETLFLIACKTFIDEKLDIFLVEAGIGGRLDTTSIIDYKNVILTNIGYDHQELLGETLDEILYEKIKISNKIKNLVCGDISNEHKELIFKELRDASISFLDENINFSDLKLIIQEFINRLFGPPSAVKIKSKSLSPSTSAKTEPFEYLFGAATPATNVKSSNCHSPLLI